MTTAVSSKAVTLADWAKTMDPDDSVADVVNLLSQTNDILEDALFKPSNMATGHRVTQLVGLPEVFYRSYNMGVPSSKSLKAQVDETSGILEAYSVVDKDLAMLNGNTAEFRLEEDQPFIEAMNQRQAKTLFYGNPANDPRQPMGFSPRYSSLGAGNGDNIIDAGGEGTDNASIWLVVWGDNQVFCHFPKGSKAGLLHEDQGELTVFDENQNRYQGYQTHYQWKNGLCVKDWRYVVRIANIDVLNLRAGNTSAVDLISLMSLALDKIPNLNAGKTAFYMNRTLFSYMRLQALSTSNNCMSIEKALSQFGLPQMWAYFLGVPLRKVDQLLNTESRVV